MTDGAPGAPGAEGASCSVTVQPDGTKLIVCGLTSAVVSDGAAGPTGPAGPQGASGAPGLNSLIRMTVEPPGPNCPAGGQKLETGLDANSNGVLDPNEVNVAATAYLCTPVACAPLYSPDNGSVAVPSLSCGATATYSCSAGFLLVGPATRTCQADGSWTDVEPSCECDGMMCNGRCANTRTDNDNCGGCDVVCNAAPPSTAQCAAGRCLSSLALGQCPYAVAVDASNLYWTDLIGNTVMKIGISGGTPVMLASGQSNPQELAVDATSVYWTNYDGGTVMKVALTGGTPTVLASGQSNPKGIAVDGTNVYWANYGGGTVMKVPLAGGEAVTLASDQLNPKGIAVDANSVYWTNNGGGYQGGSVVKMPLAGGVMTTLASGETRPEAIAVDADYVHWTLYLGNVFHTPLSGGPITTWFGGSLPLALHIAVDEAHTVYWTTEGTGTAGSLLGTVMRVGPNSSGSPTTLISGQWAAEGIAIDATAVYWARCGTESNGYAGALMKLSPR